MKKLTALLSMLGLAIGGQTVSAITMNDVNYRDTDFLGIELNASHNAESGVFDLVSNDGDGRDLLGFDPLAHTVVDAIVGFVFAGFDNNVPYLISRASFSLGTSLQSWSGAQALNVQGYEIAGGVTGSILLDIQADGMLDWHVTINSGELATNGPITLWGVYLGVLAEPKSTQTPNRTSPVPDTGSTAALFGVCVLGLAMVARRRK